MDDTPIDGAEIPEQKPSGAQRRKDMRPRILDKGVWRLGVWQPHARVLRGKVKINVQQERVPDLHAGTCWVSGDFDDPLPEDFLITGRIDTQEPTDA